MGDLTVRREADFPGQLTDGIPSEAKATAARIRLLLPQIEQALADGSSQVQVHAYMVTKGFEMTLPYFRNMLHRLRKERSHVKATYQPSPAPSGAHNTNLATQEKMGTPAAEDSDLKFKWDVKSPLKW